MSAQSTDGLFEQPDTKRRRYVPQPQQAAVGEIYAFAAAFEAALAQAFEAEAGDPS